MRYAIVRGGEGLPPPDVQRRKLDDAPYDVALEEGAVTREGQRTLVRHLQQLSAGDELVVWSLDVLQLSTAELLPILTRFLEVGVTLRVTRGATVETIHPMTGAARVLALLAEHEGRRPSPAPPSRRPRPSGRKLSPYQLKYARQMLRRGASLRAVGLLFQLAPEELSDILAGAETARDGRQKSYGEASQKLLAAVSEPTPPIGLLPRT